MPVHGGTARRPQGNAATWRLVALALCLGACLDAGAGGDDTAAAGTGGYCGDCTASGGADSGAGGDGGTGGGAMAAAGDTCGAGGEERCLCADGASGMRACDDNARWQACTCTPHTPNPVPPQGAPGEVVAEPDDEAAFLWDGSLRTFELRLAPEDLAALDRDPAAEQYVAGTLIHGGVTYGEVGIRYKGSVGAFRAPCTQAGFGGSGYPRTGKCSIKVSMNWRDPAGTFFGLRKLQFHSMGHDPSLMRDRLGYAMFRQMGVPAPRSVHARLLINGELAGLYALVEKIDGRFARSRFTEGGRGNLYKEVWPMHAGPRPYRNALETNEDELPPVHPMLDFHAAAEAGGDAAKAWLDMPLTYRYLAVDRVLVNDDGIMHFWCAAGGQGSNTGSHGNHNYYWYFAEDGSRLWLIPWDLDSSMDPGGFVQVMSDWRAAPATCGCMGYPGQAFPVPQYPPGCDPLIRAFASDPAAYAAAVDAFLAGPFAADPVDALLDTWAAQIASEVQAQADAGIVASEGGVLTPAAWQSALAELRDALAGMRNNRGYPY